MNTCRPVFWGYSLLEFGEHLRYVGLVRETNHDVQLLQLHVDWVVVLNEENFHLMLQDVRSEVSRKDLQ